MLNVKGPILKKVFVSYTVLVNTSSSLILFENSSDIYSNNGVVSKLCLHLQTRIVQDKSALLRAILAMKKDNKKEK